MVINYSEIMQKIGQQLSIVQAENEDFSDINFELSDEQSFIKIKDINHNAIYVVVRFTGASTNLGQAVLPVTLTILGLANEIERTQEFFNKFISKYNMNVEGDTTQLWLSPQVILNFNDTFSEYRSLFTVSGTFLIGNGTIRLSVLKYYYTDEEYEEIPVIGFSDITEASMRPQPFADQNGRTKSYGSFITNAFSIVTYPNKSLKLIQNIWKWKYDFTTNHSNDEFTFSGDFNFNDISNTDLSGKWKCRSANFNQRIGDIPTVELSFMR